MAFFSKGVDALYAVACRAFLFGGNMKNNLLLGVGRYLLPLPAAIWQRQVEQTAKQAAAGLSFMSPDHHRVRNLVVRELPRFGKPIPPDWITRELKLPEERVVALLDDLEKHMTFLFRNADGAVVWAYPVTAEKTPHRVTFSTGEQTYAA